MNGAATKAYITSFLVLTFSFSLSTHAADTLTTSHTFRDNGDTLVSSGGRFELGFFSPSPSSSQNRYVGIWYKSIAEGTVVWVANHEHPLTDGAGVLRVMESGAVVLVNANDTIVWSTNASRSVQNPVARLLDSGNLVVRDANDDNDENHIWQSFDDPTDTFLPGMKLGRNLVTGKEVYITSPRSVSDPASGEFTYHCDPTGYPQYVIKRGGVVTYKSGPWNGKSFSGTPNHSIVFNSGDWCSSGMSGSVFSEKIEFGPSAAGNRFCWL